MFMTLITLRCSLLSLAQTLDKEDCGRKNIPRQEVYKKTCHTSNGLTK